MAVTWADAFDSYSASADMAQVWRSNTFTFDATAGRLGGGCMKSVATACVATTPFDVFPNLGNSTVTGFAGWIKISTPPASNLAIYQNYNSAALFNGGLMVTTAGVLAATVNGTTAASASLTGLTNVCDNAWHFIDFRMAPNGGQGVMAFCDTTTQFFSNQVTFGNLAQNYGVVTSSATGNYFFDDLFWFDSSGVAPLASGLAVMAPRYMTTTRPASDSAITFAPSGGGTNFSKVNEVSADGDTSYVQNATVGQADEYGMGALGFTPASITTVMQTTRVANPGAGGANFKNRCHSGATTTDSASIIVPSVYANRYTFNHTDPNTAAAWSGPNLDAAKFGYVVA